VRVPEPLAAFVHRALAAGRGRDEITAALRDAGWSPPEVQAALAAWIDAPPLPPVPRPRAAVSPRDALVHGTLFLALGLFATHLGALGFALIDHWVASPLEPAASGRGAAVRWSVAVIVIAFPLWAWLTLRLAREGAADPGQRRSAVGRWLTAGALFVAAATVLGDLIVLVAGLLGGEVTLRFLLKTLVVAAIAGTVFLAYGPDAAGEAAP
jgi:hypothetical protein